MEEYRINDYITLKLENNKTVIYLKKQKFVQCKIILLNIPTNEIDSFGETQTIDELIDTMEKDFKENHKNRPMITSYEEFWAHCSNLHAWVINNYDTKIT